MIKMFDGIKMMKVNVKDENYKLKYNYEENDEDVQNNKVAHLKNKLQCNYCSYKTNYLRYLKEHIKGRHTKQDLVKCKWPNCGMKFTEKGLYHHEKYRSKHKSI